mmetsp:Transcript_37961/g.109195  ORF Transcript_37961/g.109195 Transcript_37961/m.109195 type:complete len:229 (+) Transcript_37961:406-1092(+)
MMSARPNNVCNVPYVSMPSKASSPTAPSSQNSKTVMKPMARSSKLTRPSKLVRRYSNMPSKVSRSAKCSKRCSTAPWLTRYPANSNSGNDNKSSSSMSACKNMPLQLVGIITSGSGNRSINSRWETVPLVSVSNCWNISRVTVSTCSRSTSPACAGMAKLDKNANAARDRRDWPLRRPPGLASSDDSPMDAMRREEVDKSRRSAPASHTMERRAATCAKRTPRPMATG